MGLRSRVGKFVDGHEHDERDGQVYHKIKVILLGAACKKKTKTTNEHYLSPERISDCLRQFELKKRVHKGSIKVDRNEGKARETAVQRNCQESKRQWKVKE